MNLITEKLELFREAILYHSTREEISDVEIEWLDWAAVRIEELKGVV